MTFIVPFLLLSEIIKFAQSPMPEPYGVILIIALEPLNVAKTAPSLSG